MTLNSTLDYCGWVRCDRPAVLGYAPRSDVESVGLCQKHWELHAESDHGTPQWYLNLKQMGYDWKIFGIGCRRPVVDESFELRKAGVTMAKKNKKDSVSNGAKDKGSGAKKMRAAWVELFKQNRAEKLTDDRLYTEMKKRFPNHQSAQFGSVRVVQVYRSGYNRGGLTGGIIPSPLSVGYDKDKNPVEARRGRKAADVASASVKKTKRVRVRAKK